MTPRRLLAALALACVCAFAGACASPTTSCMAGPALGGTWRYAGRQDTPERLALDGTLVLRQQPCGEISGEIDLTQTGDDGGTRLRGTIAGRAVDARTVRLDAAIGASTRQHLATLAGDSLTGSWLVAGPAGISATGTFHARREAP